MTTSLNWSQKCTNKLWSYNPGDSQEKTSLLSSPHPIPIQAREVRRDRENKKKEREKTGQLIEDLFAEYLHWLTFTHLRVQEGHMYPN